MLKPNF